MQKYIYIRYFKHRADEIPMDSNAICRADDVLASRKLNDYMLGLNISDWLKRYPNGCVSFEII